MFVHNPLHGSGQAGFPHPALALGEDAHAAQGVGMTDGRRRQPASEEAPHAVPEEAAGLAAPRQRATSVRHRRTSLDFPTRPKATAALGGLGISRFPCEVSAYVHGVSDRAGLWHASRYRRTRWGLPLLLTASASRRKFLTRLNTRPARSPVNASTPPLRVTPHDSGPMWVAISHSYDFCIHYTSPV